MNTLIYRQDGMEVNGVFYSKSDIEKNCGKAAVQECREKASIKKKEEDDYEYSRRQSSENDNLAAHYTVMSICTMNNF